MNAAALFQELSHAELRQIREVLLDTASISDAPRAENTYEAGTLDRVEIIQRLLGPELCRKLGIFRLPVGFKLSVVMPVYNEVRTLAQVIERVRATRLPLEIVIVDDGSHDGSREYLAALKTTRDERNADLKILFHDKNQGKGGAIKTGFLACTGD